ncbi:MAG: U32 family peptidase C-terminal domain-containing protein, partial [Lachnospiraceae bacterium]|nr:U32 family peptidase C-terminal domain-containing protein [Lachnospiraceae bacterium]
CMVAHIPELVESGAASFKVEGRMKSALYVATTARAYRRAIDDYFASEALYRSRIEWYEREVSSCTNRTFTTGFFFGKPSEESMIYDASTYVAGAVYLGYVEEVVFRDGRWLARMTQRNKFSAGDAVEIMSPQGGNLSVSVLQLFDEEGNMINSVPHAKQRFYVDVGRKLEVFDILRKR